MERQPANECFSKNLVTLRKRRFLKGTEVARELGISDVAYHKYEKGKNVASYEILLKIVDFYGINLYKFLTEIF